MWQTWRNLSEWAWPNLRCRYTAVHAIGWTAKSVSSQQMHLAHMRMCLGVRVGLRVLNVSFAPLIQKRWKNLLFQHLFGRFANGQDTTSTRQQGHSSDSRNTAMLCSAVDLLMGSLNTSLMGISFLCMPYNTTGQHSMQGACSNNWNFWSESCVNIGQCSSPGVLLDKTLMQDACCSKFRLHTGQHKVIAKAANVTAVYHCSNMSCDAEDLLMGSLDTILMGMDFSWIPHSFSHM